MTTFLNGFANATPLALIVLVSLFVAGCGSDTIHRQVRVMDQHKSTYFAKEAIVALARGDKGWILKNSTEPALTKMSDQAAVNTILAQLSTGPRVKYSLKTVGYASGSMAGGRRWTFGFADTFVRVFNDTNPAVLGDVLLRCFVNNVSGTYTQCTLKDWIAREN